ncbi:MAG: hypothetical protein B6D77_12165 [gamma proteobacterium symbiont of Ctena orbiculata]|uniref:DUF1924 domain-containing protein n=1 Tax=Candidatus Thiodiazotropha sp. CDECU1 TaxID=3065865 RepID=UPI000D5717FF|nr:DUF1924 domain-containing protein [Candidatus Thiodiazotropha sp. CDECU1]PVV08314.1 MAG: hypothetical protein B6D77_12165 [gamma proteobacterium symbiont of Ctena orbiculata]PVV18314.1 MAG: hypothetical protein B6D78_16550 [gamma proteobacterium symbiont of Ctena orbiculata]
MKPILISLLLIGTTTLQANSVESMLESYQAEGAGPFSAEQGREAWQRLVIDEKSGKPRSCSDCHGDNLGNPGQHIKTGKRIEPMAPSVNAKRLTDPKQIKKWFKRNCKWTWGRVCTPQERGDLLLFLQRH